MTTRGTADLTFGETIDMTQDSQLPALIIKDLPDRPSDFDGWTPDDLDGWISRTGSGLSRYEALLEPARLAVGLALHFLRDRVDEGAYGQDVDRLAKQIGIHEGTLRRWRAQAERRFRLEPPEKATKRAEAARKAAANAAAAKLRALARSSHEQAIDTTAEEIPNRTLGLEEAESAGSQPAATAPTGQTPPAPSPEEEEDKAIRDLVLTLLAIDPAVLARVMKRSALVNLEGLAKRAQQLTSTQTAPAAPSMTTKVKGKKRSAPAKKAPPKAPSVACAHPLTRRIGTGCGVCGISVIGKEAAT